MERRKEAARKIQNSLASYKIQIGRSRCGLNAVYWTLLTEIIEENQEKLANQQKAPSVDKERADIKRRILTVAKKRAELVKDYDVGSDLFLNARPFMSFQKLIRAAIQDQIEATRLGLQFLQVSANREYIDSLCEDQKNELAQALEEYQQGEFMLSLRVRFC